MARKLTADAIAKRIEALRKLHCISCYDVVRRAPKADPCLCSCHVEPDSLG